MLIALIVFCEIAFWVFLATGLTARYVLRWPRIGGALLWGAPAADLTLLIASAIDLRGGGDATFAHALAAIYLGVSVAFGPALVAWADVRFAHRFAGQPAPEPRDRRGPQRAARELAGWLRHLLAWSIGTGLMGLATLVIADPARTSALTGVARGWTMVLVIDALISCSYGRPNTRLLRELVRPRALLHPR